MSVRKANFEGNLRSRDCTISSFLKAIDEKVASGASVLVHGSSLYRWFDGDSDVDAILIIDRPANSGMILNAKSLRLDLRIFDTHTLTSSMLKIAVSRQDFLCTAISRGLPLRGNWQSLTQLADRLLCAPKNVDVLQTLNDVAGILSDMRRPSSKLVRIALGSSLNSCVSDYLLRSNDIWPGQGAVLSRRLEDMNETESQKLAAAFFEYLQSGVPDLYLQILQVIFAGPIEFVENTIHAPTSFSATLGRSAFRQ